MTTVELIKCEHPSCVALFHYVPARRWPNLCIEHAEEWERWVDGWTPENSVD